MTRETVPRPTPARAATSSRVGLPFRCLLTPLVLPSRMALRVGPDPVDPAGMTEPAASRGTPYAEEHHGSAPTLPLIT
ncbi:hypothetical protein Slala02_53840 [Streptomyces lavendulae subsp. lavendulae]|nr:hypothetical protein Slala01_07010 [Streptomyces lavendulae subsp. lavendulae]GLX29564.1 hypothetical protein Slala02_53840 [Streptomyces lavendulae subsp. lavendulae]